MWMFARTLLLLLLLLNTLQAQGEHENGGTSVKEATEKFIKEYIKAD